MSRRLTMRQKRISMKGAANELCTYKLEINKERCKALHFLNVPIS
jgi:hypothetical protein